MVKLPYSYHSPLLKQAYVQASHRREFETEKLSRRIKRRRKTRLLLLPEHYYISTRAAVWEFRAVVLNVGRPINPMEHSSKFSRSLFKDDQGLWGPSILISTSFQSIGRHAASFEGPKDGLACLSEGIIATWERIIPWWSPTNDQDYWPWFFQDLGNDRLIWNHERVKN